jgi:hypothetical protein
MAKRKQKLVIKGAAVGTEKGRLKGRLKNHKANKGDFKAYGKRGRRKR